MVRKNHIVVTEKSGVQAIQIARLLPQLHDTAQIDCVRSLNQALEASMPDMIIAGCCETELLNVRMTSGHIAILFLGKKNEVEDCLASCVSNGFLCMERDKIDMAIPQLLAMSNRLYFLQKRENSLQRKLGDTKLVNRAKLLLVTHLQMSETEAHRYIEKTAMDNGDSLRDVALRLIRTYEE